MSAAVAPRRAARPFAFGASLTAAGIALALIGANIASGGIAARIPALCVPIATFIASQALVRRARPSWRHPVCARNWLLFLFGVQLVVIPLLIMATSPSLSVLPHLPSDSAIGAGALLQSLAYISCVTGMALASARRDDSRAIGAQPATRRLQRAAKPKPMLIGVAMLVGLVGVYLRFGSLTNLLEYFSGTSSLAYDITRPNAQVPIAQSASTVLLPFLGVAFAALLCRKMDRGAKEPGEAVTRIPMALLLIAALVVSNAVYTYNRGAVVMPLLAVAATYSLRLRRVPPLALAGLGATFFVTFLAVGGFRNSYFLTQAGATPPSATLDASQQIQVYGQGPQFLGYLLDYAPAAAVPMGGGTLVSSALSPLPVIGKNFRAGSGTVLYNELIYGGDIANDQIIPLEGELYWNFSVYGVVIGFAALGMVVARIDRRSRKAPSAFHTYVWQFTGFWTAFLVVASVSVLAQVALYSIGPLCLVLIIDTALSSRSTKLASRVT